MHKSISEGAGLGRFLLNGLYKAPIMCNKSDEGLVNNPIVV
jgi:hypothetical protein